MTKQSTVFIALLCLALVLELLAVWYFGDLHDLIPTLLP